MLVILYAMYHSRSRVISLLQLFKEPFKVGMKRGLNPFQGYILIIDILGQVLHVQTEALLLTISSRPLVI